LILVALANLGFAQALYLSLLVVLPARAHALGGRQQEVVLAVVVGCGAMVALLVGVVVGGRSDAVMRRRGTRRLSFVTGAAVAVAGLAAASHATSPIQLVLIWSLAQVGLSSTFVVSTALLVDWFGSGQRGRASGAAAVGQVAGALLASVVAVATSGHVDRAGGAAAVLMLCASLPVALLWETHPAVVVRMPWRPDTGLDAAPVGPGRAGAYRDVWLCWAVRAVMTLSNTLLITYVNFFVTDELKVDHPQQFVGVAAALSSGLVLLGAVVSGTRSDRSGRRKRYVIWATVLMTVGEAVLGVWPQPGVALAACAVIGLGYGVYLAVDQALTIDVLPDPSTYGRDVGVLNTSTAVPQVVGPAMGALLLGLDLGYAGLFLVGALITLVAAPLVWRIRSVP
jgi:MFS family permease